MISVFNTTQLMNGVLIANLDQCSIWAEKYPTTFVHNKYTLRKAWDNIKKSHRKYNFFKQEMQNTDTLENEVIYMGFTSLLDLEYKIKCRKLIIQDTLFLTFVLFNIEYVTLIPEYPSIIKSKLKTFECDEIVFLIPEYLREQFEKVFPDLQYKVFHKKINLEALYSIEYKENNKIVARNKLNIDKPFDYVGDMEHGKDIGWFNYSSFYYSPRKDCLNMEQFNRTIYEFLLLDKTVYMDEDVYHNVQPMSSVLKHYNIKHNKATNKLYTNVEELKERISIKHTMGLVK